MEDKRIIISTRVLMNDEDKLKQQIIKSSKLIVQFPPLIALFSKHLKNKQLVNGTIP